MRLKCWMISVLFQTLVISFGYSIEVPIASEILVAGSTIVLGGSAKNPLHRATVMTLYVAKYKTTWHDLVEVYNWAIDMGIVEIRNSKVFAKSEVTQESEYPLVDLEKVSEYVFSNNGHLQVVSAKEAFPCIEVSWFGAVFYCNFLSRISGLEDCYAVDDWSVDTTKNGYRLPTFDEWEYVARGGDLSKGYHFSGSDLFDLVGWDKENSGGRLQEIGKKAPNELGLYDMSGNVNEFCTEILAPLKGYQAGEHSLVTGNRIYRGGSVTQKRAEISDYTQNIDYPHYLSPFEDVGFRVFRSGN